MLRSTYLANYDQEDSRVRAFGCYLYPSVSETRDTEVVTSATQIL